MTTPSNNWDKIMIVVSVFQLISCLAVPIAFVKLRNSHPDLLRPFSMPFGKTISYITYLTVTYLLIQCGTLPLIMSLAFHVAFFAIYCIMYHQNFTRILLAVLSAWSLFIYLTLITIAGHLQQLGVLDSKANLCALLVIFSIVYKFLVNQKSYNEKLN